MPKGDRYIDELVAFAESRRLKAADLTGPLEIHPDRLHNGGLREIIAMALEDDDPDWIHDQIDSIAK